MNPKVIVIDGKTYNSVNEMPPEVRAKYEKAMSRLRDENGNHFPDALENMDVFADKNKNGMPDIMENLYSGSMITTNSMKIIVNGQEVNVLDDLPPDVRAKYEKAMSQLDKNQNGIPDFLEMMSNIPGVQVQVQQPNTMQSTPSYSTPMSTPMPQSTPLNISSSPTIEPETSNGWMLVLAGAALLFLCVLGAVGVWYFFMVYSK